MSNDRVHIEPEPPEGLPTIPPPWARDLVVLPRVERLTGWMAWVRFADGTFRGFSTVCMSESEAIYYAADRLKHEGLHGEVVVTRATLVFEEPRWR